MRDSMILASDTRQPHAPLAEWPAFGYRSPALAAEPVVLVESKAYGIRTGPCAAVPTCCAWMYHAWATVSPLIS